MNNLKKFKLNSRGFPEPLKVKCFKCSKTFFIKYVVPNKAYSKKNNWEYWTNPQWKNQPTHKDRQICNSCLLNFYYDKETYWETMKDLKKRQKLRTYIHEGKFAV